MADETTDHLGDEPDLIVDDTVGPDPDEGWTPPRDRSREAALVAAGLLVVSAVLCVIAPFRAVYTLRAQGISASFDGWGRYDLSSSGQHGPRYGIALTVVALVLIIAAASRLSDLRPVHPYPEPEPDLDADVEVEIDVEMDQEEDAEAVVLPDVARTTDDRLAATVGVAGSALLLGVLGALALNIQSTVSNVHAIAAGGNGEVTNVDVGGMLWFLLGAWVVSVLAVYLPWFEARRRA